jgi:hypothetical protein
VSSEDQASSTRASGDIHANHSRTILLAGALLLEEGDILTLEVSGLPVEVALPSVSWLANVDPAGAGDSCARGWRQPGLFSLCLHLGLQSLQVQAQWPSAHPSPGCRSARRAWGPHLVPSKDTSVFPTLQLPAPLIFLVNRIQSSPPPLAVTVSLACVSAEWQVLSPEAQVPALLWF